MHASMERVSGATLPGTNAKDFQEYADGFFGPNGRRHYAAMMVSWITTYTRDDRAGLYYPFALTYTGNISSSAAVTRFFHVCVNASREIFPELSRSNSKRHHSDKSVGLIVIPCVSASGLVHWHGLIRIPVLAIAGSADEALISIHDGNTHIQIAGPEALRIATAQLHDQFYPRLGVSSSLWIANQTQGEGHRRVAAHNRRYPHVCQRSLAYLQNANDGEVRAWNDTEFLPHALFTRLTE